MAWLPLLTLLLQGPNGEPIYTPEQRHQIFVDRLNAWLRANCGQLIDKFHKYDGKGCGTWLIQPPIRPLNPQ